MYDKDEGEDVEVVKEEVVQRRKDVHVAEGDKSKGGVRQLR